MFEENQCTRECIYIHVQKTERDKRISRFLLIEREETNIRYPRLSKENHNLAEISTDICLRRRFSPRFSNQSYHSFTFKNATKTRERRSKLESLPFRLIWFSRKYANILANLYHARSKTNRNLL